MAGGGHRPGTPLPPVVRDGLQAQRERSRAFCWVADPAGPWPGLVTEWARGPDGWQARVVYLVSEGGAPVVVSAWLGADRLRPAP